MKRWIIAILALMLCVGCFALKSEQDEPSSAVAAQPRAASSAIVSSSEAAQPQQPACSMIEAKGPIAVTSLGQGTDSILVREMLVDLELDFDFLPAAHSDELGKYNTVILALGASSKALASNGVSPQQEFDRCKELTENLSADCTVILVRLSDAQNQDPITAKLLPLALPHTDMILAIKNGLDETTVKYAQQNSIPLRSCDKIREITALFGELLG